MAAVETHQWTQPNARPLTRKLDSLLDGGYLPHAIVRAGIRRNCKDRLNSVASASLAEAAEKKLAFVELLRSKPIAIETDAANKQHYEVDTGVLSACLGPRMKYSSCLYPTGKETLAEAEVAMLKTYVEKAELKDGMKILDLGYVVLVKLAVRGDTVA